MAYQIYIPDAAFLAGGEFYGQDKTKVVILVGEIADSPTTVYATGGPQFVQKGPYDWAFGHKDGCTVTVLSNMWSRLSSDIKTQMAHLVAKGVLVVNDGAGDMTPAQILA
jgi:hypothetical protein